MVARKKNDVSPKSEIRKDYVQEKYVIVAPHRAKRPNDVEGTKHTTRETCLFCPDHLAATKPVYTVGGKKNWNIFVMPNKYPAVTPDNPKAYGHQEVVVETPHHDVHLEELPVPRIEELIGAYASRTIALTKDPEIDYILIFKNQGGRAGASIQHAHSQIIALHFLPPHLFNKSQNVQAYKLQYGTCVYEDTMAKERRGPRWVWEDENIVAFCPWASLHEYELWIMPKRHVDNITLLTKAERKSFATILRKSLRKIVELNLPYNFYFHQVINDEDQHLYMKVTPRGTTWAGLEIGSGVVINPVTPEEAAVYYRKGIESY